MVTPTNLSNFEPDIFQENGDGWVDLTGVSLPSPAKIAEQEKVERTAQLVQQYFVPLGTVVAQKLLESTPLTLATYLTGTAIVEIYKRCAQKPSASS